MSKSLKLNFVIGNKCCLIHNRAKVISKEEKEKRTLSFKKHYAPTLLLHLKFISQLVLVQVSGCARFSWAHKLFDATFLKNILPALARVEQRYSPRNEGTWGGGGGGRVIHMLFMHPSIMPLLISHPHFP